VHPINNQDICPRHAFSFIREVLDIWQSNHPSWIDTSLLSSSDASLGSFSSAYPSNPPHIPPITRQYPPFPHPLHSMFVSLSRCTIWPLMSLIVRYIFRPVNQFPRLVGNVTNDHLVESCHMVEGTGKANYVRQS